MPQRYSTTFAHGAFVSVPEGIIVYQLEHMAAGIGDLWGHLQ
jgi:hypothetical protein